MKLTVLMIFPIFWNYECLAKSIEQGSVTEMLEVTPYPDTQKQIINMKNVSPEVTNILRENNITDYEQINAMKTKLINSKTYYEVIPSSTYPAPTATKDIDEEIRLNSIKHSLEKTLRENNDKNWSANAQFEYSLAAICDMPKHMTINEWFGQKTWNIFFTPNFRQYNIKSVTLRLFKVPLQTSKGSEECNPDGTNYYKFTVSVYSRKRKEIKKKPIYMATIEINKHGWIEIDALATLRFWSPARNNYGLAIDIHDQDDNQLDAKEHFHLQNCEAGSPVPWGGYKLLAKTTGSDNTENDVDIFRNMYTGPRFDLASLTPADYRKTSSESREQSDLEQKRVARHLRHSFHHHHHHFQQSGESLEDTHNHSHQMNARQRDHSHRSNSKVEET